MREGLGFQKIQKKNQKKSPKLYFGENKTDMKLLFDFHISNGFIMVSQRGY